MSQESRAASGALAAIDVIEVVDGVAVPVADKAIGLFRQRVVNLRTLSWPLRLIVGLVLAFLVVVGVALAQRDPARETIPFSQSQEFGNTVVPFSIFVVGLTALALTWALFLTAAIHARWFVRFPLLLAFTFFA